MKRISNHQSSTNAGIRLDEKIILYGAGKRGKRLLEEFKQNKWCSISMVVDMNYECITDFPVRVHSPFDIDINGTQRILIGIADEKIWREAVCFLSSIGINSERIISRYDSAVIESFYEYDEFPTLDCKEGEPVKIGFIFDGGMGDCVISLKIYQDIVRRVPDSVVDIISDRSFVKSVYYGQPNLRNIETCHSLDSLRRYDFVIKFCGFELSLIRYDEERIRNTELFLIVDKLKAFRKQNWDDGLDMQYRHRLILDISKIKNYNRYTVYNMTGAFDIETKAVEILFDESFKTSFEQMNLPAKYITFNYGADKKGYGDVQTKMWPYEYHCRLNEMLHSKFPDIKIVQLGASDVRKVEGADRYILGENLELVKYVLKNSLLHFDCEGGLVHLASQIGTKCCVVFGPTPSWFLGYENNININPLQCGDCKNITKEWAVNCVKYDRPECMYSITPDVVCDEVSEFITKMCK